MCKYYKIRRELKMKCTDCENYYLGCDTEVFNYGYEQDKAEECEFFLEIEVAKG